MNMKRPVSLCSAERGFTLIELFVGIAIVAIILALGVPSLRNWMTAQRVSSVATELVTDLRYARSEAISANMISGVAYSNAGNGCYTIFRGPPARNVSCDCTLPTPCTPPLVNLKTVILPPGDVLLSWANAPATEVFQSGSELKSEDTGVGGGTSDNVPSIATINGGHASRQLLVRTSAGLHRPNVCAPSSSKIPGFKAC